VETGHPIQFFSLRQSGLSMAGSLVCHAKKFKTFNNPLDLVCFDQFYGEQSIFDG
jgi:hypothetical protein